MSPPNFEALGDAALEARIVSWVLGDASAFEAAELERLCEERPELLVFRRRMRALHGLLTEAEAAMPDESWKLPEAKRRALDAVFADTDPPAQPAPQPLRPVRRGRNALLAIAACLALSTVVWLSVPRNYEAVAVIEIKPRSPHLSPLGRSMAETSGKATIGTPQFFATESGKIKSPNSLKKVTERLNLTDRWGVDEDTAVKRLKQIVVTDNPRGTDLIEIRARHQDKKLAAEIANETTRAYRDYRVETAKRDQDRSLAEIAKAARDQKDKVDELRKVLDTIVRTKDITYTGDDFFYTNQGMDKAHRANTAVQSSRQSEQLKAELESQIQTLLKYQGDSLMVYASGLNLPDNTVRVLYPEYLAEKRKLDKLRSEDLGNRHPDVQVVAENVELMKKQLDEGILNLRETLQVQLELATNHLSRVEVTNNEKRERAIQRGLANHDYVEAKREFESAQAMLQQMEIKLIGERIGSEIPDESIVIHQEATIDSTKPAGPLAELTSRWFSGSSDQSVQAETATVVTYSGTTDELQTLHPADAQPLPELAAASQPAPAISGGIRMDLTNGIRSGDGAINRNNIDAILNNPARGAAPPAPPDEAAAGEIALHFDESEHRQTGIDKRPSAPSSSMTKVIAANTSRALETPVPSVDALSSRVFGDGDDFGDGWGSSEDAPGEAQQPLARGRVTETPRLGYAFTTSPPAIDPPAGVPTLGDIPTAGTLFEDSKPKLEANREFDYPTEFEPPELPNTLGRPGGNTATPFPVTPATPTDFETRDLGVVLEGELTDSSNPAAKSDQVRDRLLNEVDAAWTGAVPGKPAPSPPAQPIDGIAKQSDSSVVSGGLAQRELLRRQSAIREGEHLHLEGREAYEKGDYEAAANELDEALNQVPDASPFAERRASIASDLAAANVALSQEARKVGRYDEARDALEKALVADPSSQAAKDALAELDDPIRTNPALTDEHTQNVDQIRRSLYMAEGHFNLGKFDDAKTQYEDVLRTDPYNKAARRGLERVATAKTDYYRAAYDHTRAELLSQVDSAWELSVPAAKSFDFSNELKTAEDPFSTFSLHISDASFRQAQAALDQGERPDPASIRVEQFYNAIDYGDPSPSNSEPVAARIEQSAHPIIPGRNLIRLAVKTAAAGRSAAQPLRLTLLIDESGSMARDDRRAAMQSALTQLATLLTVDDRISVIGFSRTPRLLADSLPGDQAHTLPDLVNLAASEAGTNLEEALNLAANLANRQLTPGAQNRIVLFTDGAANLGNADPTRLAKRITTLRQQGIAFDAAGISATDLNDQLLSELTRHGNGRYQVIDGGDAGGRFAKQLAGAFRPAAENVKVQVRFNPERVASHRLVGFEEHRLNTEDFRNDAVDAAELAAEEAGVALYQIQTLPDGRGEVGEMSVRFLDTATGTMVERSWTIPYDPATPAFDQATPSLQLAGLALLVAEKLKPGPLADAINLRDLTQVRATLKNHYSQSPPAQQLLKMADQVQ
jgi:uncharacterized protein involved in exopolysaccharide biosynthesis/tetratricopeptide (TPR) repeat protein